MLETDHVVDKQHNATRAIAVQLRGVRREFEGGVVAVEQMDLQVQAGEFVALLGPSGCGKSTLLRLIAHLDQPNQGAIDWREAKSPSEGAVKSEPLKNPSPLGRGWPRSLRRPRRVRAEERKDHEINDPQKQPRPHPNVSAASTPTLPEGEGEQIPNHRSSTEFNTHKPTPGSMAYVFQDAHLLPWRTVLQNVMLPLELRGRASRADGAGDFRKRAEAALVQVGLQEALHRYPAQLSGGMRMRASLARALVTEPAMLLLDEPFAALDEITRQGLDEQLRELWLRRGMTVIFVTHAIHEATFLAQRAVVLSRRPARVVLDHAIDLPMQRDGLLRTTAEFAAQTRVLYEALVKGEAWA